MKQIRNTSANPLAAVLLNVFVMLGLGDILIGQTNKGMIKLLFSIIGLCLCCVPGVIMIILCHVDLYLCASALQQGETLGENEYKLELLYKIVRVVDKSAVYRGS